jgi:Flp pilus assembly pilin Flp
MRSGFWKLCLRLHRVLAREEGQDLIEYVLLAMLLAVAAVASARTVAAPLNSLINNAVVALNVAL